MSKKLNEVARAYHKKWIQGAIKKPGALHKELGVPVGEKIPEKKIGERARLARTLKGMHK